MHATASITQKIPMLSPSHVPSMDNILFVDKIPLLAFAFQEIICGVSRSASVRYEESYFSVLSRPTDDESDYGLIIISSDVDDSSIHLQVPVGELRQKFPGARIMVYSVAYDSAIIEMAENGTIDACIHLFDPVQEVKSAYEALLRGEGYISAMLCTLYYDYKLQNEKILPGRYFRRQ
jgi:hypothetical protein